MTETVARAIAKSVRSQQQMDGEGARVNRSIGSNMLPDLDPFLLLDEFEVEAPGGFPDHPHRGFETVTYMFEGEFLHEDFKGHKGHLGPGDLQWMSAGRGMVHAEIPADHSRAHGLQLWINLAAKDKMMKPRYQEYPAAKIKQFSPEEGIQIKVIAGEAYGVKSPIKTKTPTLFVDIRLAKGKTIEQEVPEDYAGFIYTIAGTALFGSSKHQSGAHHTLVLSDNGGTKVPVKSLSDDCHFVLIAGKPLREPIVQEGPFVMNSRQQVAQAIQDYSRGLHGFEGAREWKSTIRDLWSKPSKKGSKKTNRS
ncbi:RmlC-like cupin domain-containing protein [Dichotomocladium elegans]|nr:RmlC-like cupin domain-containing protein [Dichotomocladium elegans]